MRNPISAIEVKFRCRVCSFINTVQFNTYLDDMNYSVEKQKGYLCTKCEMANLAVIPVDETYMKQVFDEQIKRLKND